MGANTRKALQNPAKLVYLTPKIYSYSATDLLEELGPALANYDPPPPGGGGGGGSIGPDPVGGDRPGLKTIEGGP